MAFEVGHYTIVDYRLFESSIHGEAEKQLQQIKRRASQDTVEDHKCLVCGKEFCLIISPTYFEKGLRELCEIHNREYHDHVYAGRNDPHKKHYYEVDIEWAEARNRGEL